MPQNPPYTLKLRRRVWFVRYYVPREHWPTWGSREIERTLGTRDGKAAASLAPAKVTEIQREISQRVARVGTVRVPASDPHSIQQTADEMSAALRDGRIKAGATMNEHGEWEPCPVDAALDRALDAHLDTYPEADRHPITGHPSATHPRLPDVLTHAHRQLSDPGYKPLSQWVSEYLKSIAHLAPATVQGRKTELARFTKWAGAQSDVRMFRPHNAAAYVDEIINKWDRKPNTKIAALGKLTGFFAWVKFRAQLDFNPFDRVSSQITKSNRGTEKTRRQWKESELVKLLGSACPRPDLAAVTLIALYSGARIDEVCMAKSANVNLGDATTTGNLHPQSWRVTSGHGKTASAIRSIPIHPLLAPLVARLVETSWDGYLISGLGQGKSGTLKRSHYLSKRFGAWCDDVGLDDPRLTFHTLRNTFLQRLRRAKVDLSTRKPIVGHVQKDMTDGVYSDAEWSELLEGVHKAEYGAADTAARLLVQTLPGNPPKGAIRKQTLSRSRPSNAAT